MRPSSYTEVHATTQMSELSHRNPTYIPRQNARNRFYFIHRCIHVGWHAYIYAAALYTGLGPTVCGVPRVTSTEHTVLQCHTRSVILLRLAAVKEHIPYPQALRIVEEVWRLMKQVNRIPVSFQSLMHWGEADPLPIPDHC